MCEDEIMFIDDESRAEGQSRLNDGLGDHAIYRSFGGMCWPAAGDGIANLEWSLRYGDSEKFRMAAASVISAYRELIALPEKKRNAVIRELRKGAGKESTNVKLTGSL